MELYIKHSIDVNCIINYISSYFPKPTIYFLSAYHSYDNGVSSKSKIAYKRVLVDDICLNKDFKSSRIIYKHAIKTDVVYSLPSEQSVSNFNVNLSADILEKLDWVQDNSISVTHKVLNNYFEKYDGIITDNNYVIYFIKTQNILGRNVINITGLDNENLNYMDILSNFLDQYAHKIRKEMNELDSELLMKKDECEMELDNIRNDHQSDVDLLKIEHDNEIMSIKTEHEEETSDLQTRHEEEINKIKLDHEE